MSNFIITSYYTICEHNKIYENKAMMLIESMKQYKIPYHVEKINSFGGWLKNVRYKPTFLKRMMKQFNNINIAWVDCDALFMVYPELFDHLDCNIGVYLFDRMFYRKKGPKEILSGTIFLKNCPETYLILDEWEKECQKNRGVWDQKCLQNVLKGREYYELPPTYCKIYDTMKGIKDAVITHYQVSRTIRSGKGKIKV